MNKNQIDPKWILWAKNNVPLTSSSYRAKYGKKELDEMRNAAGIPVTTRAPKNDHTQSLRSLAGIL
jgi:hypothetical protein